MKDRLTTAPLPLERPQGSFGTWNAPWRLWNARRAILYCSLAGDIISVLLSSGLLFSAWNRHSLLPPPCLCAASQKRAKQRSSEA